VLTFIIPTNYDIQMSQGVDRRGYVFVVDKFSYPVHRSRGFCGVKEPKLEWNFSGQSGLYADLLGTRPGDLVFLYQRRIDESPEDRGFRGVYEITSRPFVDTQTISWNGHTVRGECPECGSTYPEDWGRDPNKGPWTCDNCDSDVPQGEHIVPNRVLIQPDNYYPNSVTDNTAYVDQTDPGFIWTKIFRKMYGVGTERSAAPLLPEETEKLLRLLERENEGTSEVPDFEPYPAQENRDYLSPKLGDGPEVPYEHWLHAWILNNIDEEIPVLSDIVGPLSELEWFGNEIVYGIGRSKVDLLLLHERDGHRYKATVGELKQEEITVDNINQIDRYSYWISQLATANAEPPVEDLQLHPVIIGSGIEPDARTKLGSMEERQLEIPYSRADSRTTSRTDCTVQIQTPTAVEYTVSDGSIRFEYISGQSSL